MILWKPRFELELVGRTKLFCVKTYITFSSILSEEKFLKSHFLHYFEALKFYKKIFSSIVNNFLIISLIILEHYNQSTKMLLFSHLKDKNIIFSNISNINFFLTKSLLRGFIILKWLFLSCFYLLGSKSTNYMIAAS